MSNVKSLLAAAALTLIGGAALAQSGIASTESYSVAQVGQVATAKADKSVARVATGITRSTESYSVAQISRAAKAPAAVHTTRLSGQDGSFADTQSYSVSQIERVANGFVDSTDSASQASPRIASTAPATVR